MHTTMRKMLWRGMGTGVLLMSVLAVPVASVAWAQVQGLPSGPPSLRAPGQQSSQQSAQQTQQPPAFEQPLQQPPALPTNLPRAGGSTGQFQQTSPAVNPSGGTSTLGSQIQEQANGLYPVIERSPTLPLGVLQRAWDAPYASSGQTAPGVIRYVWRPNFVMPVRVREFMVTTIHIPDFDKISSVVVGDPVIFEVSEIRPNIIGVRPNHAGADSNITVIGTSGNVYSFYVRSEGFNSDQISDITVFVEGNPPFTVGQAGSSGGGGQSSASGGGATLANYDPVNAASGAVSGMGVRVPDYLRKVAFDPENLSFDMKIFAPSLKDAEIAPLRVFNDGVWTYFDFGDRTDSIPRPAVYLLQDDVDTLVNTRTAGPIGNLLIAEAVGDFTLRSGTKVVCIYRQDSLQNRRNGAVPPTLEQPYIINKDQLEVAPPTGEDGQISTESKNQQSDGHFLDSISNWFE